jgi:hypothetical protein
MKTFNLKEISNAIAIFCHRVKLGQSCYAEDLHLNNRAAQLLKIALTSKFSKSKRHPFDFPRLFILDDKKHQLYHKVTTPNDVDLSNIGTVKDIITLMTFVGRTKRGVAKEERTEVLQSSGLGGRFRLNGRTVTRIVIEFHDGVIDTHITTC